MRYESIKLAKEKKKPTHPVVPLLAGPAAGAGLGVAHHLLKKKPNK